MLSPTTIEEDIEYALSRGMDEDAAITTVAIDYDLKYETVWEVWANRI